MPIPALTVAAAEKPLAVWMQGELNRLSLPAHHLYLDLCSRTKWVADFC